MPNDRLDRAVDELANALQVAAVLATRLRATVGTATQDAADLESAVEKAVRALKSLQPSGNGPPAI
jgi:hypothetical protein